MRRLEVDDDEHAKLLDVIARQYRATRDPELRELAAVVASAPRVVAYVVSVEIPRAPAFTKPPESRTEANAGGLAGLEAPGHSSVQPRREQRPVPSIHETKAGGEAEASPPMVAHVVAQVGAAPPRTAAGG